MATVEIINITLQIWECVICFLFGVGLYFEGRFHVHSGHLYLKMLILNTCSMLFDLVALFLTGRDGQVVNVMLWIANTISFASNILLIPVFTQYLIAYLQGRNIYAPRFILFAVWSLASLMLLALFVNLFSHFIYRIGPDNIYYRCRFHTLSCACGLLGLLNAAYLVLRYGHRLAIGERASLFAYIIIPMAAIPLQELFSGLAFITLGNTLSLTLIYLCFQVRQAQQFSEQEKSLIQTRYTTAFGQIHPHFIFNSLNSIQYLCKSDPDQASFAIRCFAKYLRVNMDSLTCSRPIPLSEDLMHLENYMILQRMRFPEIDYKLHLEATDFMVPLLTLQPLVANAIRYGLRQFSKGGMIFISSWIDDKSYHLEITDEGLGVPINQTNTRHSNLAIADIKSKIELMCHGLMQVENHPGQGVTVHVQFPKEKNDISNSR